MAPVEIRAQLHRYIDTADDTNLEAIYAILQGNQQAEKFSPEDLKEFYDRRAEYLEGNTPTYSVKEAHDLIRQSIKR